ncbi:hypothetical protein [Nitrosomonas sp. Nm34]|uniref:hypothetical protein n=1 Tax=Nitrosomonas sp. Nm34 TaxID=1881055 RepID=UPI0008F360EB|nr:hypothetical protein [Nitrosomonas sp. Nm34]SFI75095.1 hypothetical protein SAMN05428978_103232 [Nitrosomonas sp. Nm34]
MSNFIEKCLVGEAILDDIDDYIEEWHDTNPGIPLHQFLGMNRSEYSLWVAEPCVLPFILKAHRQNRDVSEVLDEADAKIN